VKGTVLLRQILISASFIICLLTAGADTFDADDAATHLDNLVRKSLLLEQNILSLQKSSSPKVEKVWECLNELYYKLEVISVRIDGLYSMVSMASLMNDKLDEQTVLDFLNEDATNFLNHVEVSRRGINLTAGYCSSINVHELLRPV
jgi:hypothetical protein